MLILRTEWSPIRSVIIRLITKSDDDRIGRNEVLLPINHKNYNFREKKKELLWFIGINICAIG